MSDIPKNPADGTVSLEKVIRYAKQANGSSFAAPTGLDAALVCLKNISKEYQRL